MNTRVKIDEEWTSKATGKEYWIEAELLIEAKPSSYAYEYWGTSCFAEELELCDPEIMSLKLWEYDATLEGYDNTQAEGKELETEATNWLIEIGIDRLPAAMAMKKLETVANDIIDAKTGKLVAVCHRDLPQMDIDAQRLVDCYNACEGIDNPNELIEGLKEAKKFLVGMAVKFRTAALQKKKLCKPGFQGEMPESHCDEDARLLTEYEAKQEAFEAAYNKLASLGIK